MALTATERKVLELARQRLVTRQSSIICLALHSAGAQLRAHVEADRLQSYIRRKLGRCNTLCTWQLQRDIVHSGEQRRADRIAWIDWMLDQ